MKIHTTSFKDEIKTLGKQQKIQIIYNNKILDEENINSINYSYEGDLLKSIMKGLNLDININIPKGSELGLKYGLLVNGKYEYIDYGKFIVYEVEKQEDTNSYSIICYDKLLFSMIPYEKMPISYPITLENYLKEITAFLKLDYSSKNKSFANYNKVIPTELYLDTEGNDLGYTFRDVLDEIAQATASVICINNDDELEVRYINDVNDTIDEEYFKDINVNFGQKYGPINSIVLSRSAEADNVYLSNQPSIEKNGLCEIKIVDNQIMNFNNRDEFLPDIYNVLNGLEYYLNDFSSTGIMYYDILDRYNIQIGENTYSCVMLNDEINITQGLEENIYTNMPESSETDYTKSDKTDRRLNQTYLIVDKQNKKIESVVTETTKQNEKISQITQTVDELNSKISDVADITVSDTSIIAKLILNDINECEPIRVVVRPIVDHISYLYPSNSLFPSSSLKIRTRILKFNNTKTGEIVLYEIPDNLYYYNDEISDEFVLDYNAKTCLIIKRVGIDEDGKAYLLENERTIEYEYPTIELTSGDYEVSIVGYNSAYLFVRLMATNIYTTQFATKVELESKITQTKSEIDAEVKQKVNEKEIIAKLNLAVKDGQGVINITSNQITIDSDNFKLTKEGKITASSGQIAGWTINNDYLGKGLAGIKGIGNTTSDDDVFYAGQGLGYNGTPAFHVTNKGNMYVKSLNIRGRNSSDVGKITVYNDQAQVGTTITYDNVNSYSVTASSGGTTPTKGKCMHGYSMGHDYRCDWDGSRLFFMVDDANIGYVMTHTSDVRLKKDIIDLPEDLIHAIEEVEFKQFKLIEGKDKYKFGIIAQDLVNAFEKYGLNYKEYEIIEEVQVDLTDKELYFMIDYEQVLILKNQLLENRIKALERKVEKILEKI